MTHMLLWAVGGRSETWCGVVNPAATQRTITWKDADCPDCTAARDRARGWSMDWRTP